MPSVTVLERMMTPDFFEFGGCVFARGIASPRLHREVHGGRRFKGKWLPDRTTVEIRENHIQLLDLVPGAHHARAREAAFKAAEALGRVLAHAWLGCLVATFPSDRFRVYYVRGTYPSVRAHRVYPGEPFWIAETERPEERARGHLLILDSRPASRLRAPARTR